MMTIPEILEHVNFVYYSATDVSAMYDALAKLKGVLQNDSINEKNKNRALSLHSKLSVKLGITKYVTGGFDEKYLATMIRRFAELQLPIDTFPSTHLLVDAGMAMVRFIGALLDGMAKTRSNIIDDYDNIVALDIDGCNALIEQCQRAMIDKQNCSNYDIVKEGKFVSIFPQKVACVDIEQCFSRYIDRMTKEATMAKKVVYDNAYSKIIQECIQIQPRDELESWDYFPGKDPNTNASIYVMCSPSDKEVELTVVSRMTDKHKQLCVVNTETLLRQQPEDMSVILDSIATAGNVALFVSNDNLDVYSGDQSKQLCNDILRLALYIPIFIHDTSAKRAIYSQLTAVADEGSILPDEKIAYQYLAMPVFDDVVELLSQLGIAGMQDVAMQDHLRTYCKFAGYYGLNKAIFEYGKTNSVEAFQGCYCQYSEMYHDSCLAYIRELTTQAQLIDSKWGDLSQLTSNTVNQRKEFDYDIVRDLNYDNVAKILSSNYSACDKAAVLVGYCMLRGDDNSVWASLTDEQRLERLTVATQALAQFLCTEFVPKVYYFDEEELKAGWWGVCCEAGKVIKYDNAHAANFSGIFNTLCHEVRHSLQHTIVDGGYIDGFHDQFVLCVESVAELKYGFSNYSNTTKGNAYASYAVQYVESDARLFAAHLTSCYSRACNQMGIE